MCSVLACITFPILHSRTVSSRSVDSVKRNSCSSTITYFIDHLLSWCTDEDRSVREKRECSIYWLKYCESHQTDKPYEEQSVKSLTGMFSCEKSRAASFRARHSNIWLVNCQIGKISFYCRKAGLFTYHSTIKAIQLSRNSLSRHQRCKTLMKRDTELNVQIQSNLKYQEASSSCPNVLSRYSHVISSKIYQPTVSGQCAIVIYLDNRLIEIAHRVIEFEALLPDVDTRRDPMRVANIDRQQNSIASKDINLHQ